MTPPPALAWVQEFVESLNRALLESLEGWELLEDADPLRWRLHIRWKGKILNDEPPLVRHLLQAWANANNCTYRRSELSGRDFYALIYLRGLRPESRVNPFVERK